MTQLTIEIPDELAVRLQPVQNRMSDILELGLRQLQPTVTAKKKNRRMDSASVFASLPPGRTPTVAMPIAHLQSLIGLIPTMEGDALLDTEAMYDEV